MNLQIILVLSHFYLTLIVDNFVGILHVYHETCCCFRVQTEAQ